jgi:hypothetical protein
MQMVMGTLMNLCDHPNRTSTGEAWREGERLMRRGCASRINGTNDENANPCRAAVNECHTFGRSVFSLALTS